MGPVDPRIGTLVAGRFRVQSLLGEGQMALVYLAEQVSMQRAVALKVLHPSLVGHASAPLRFRREVEAVKRLRSPHSIIFYDFGQTGDGALFIAMELLGGEPLRARMAREGALAPALVLSIIRQICGCLAEAHAASVLHRDLKPENIFLCPPEAGSRGPFVKVLDFGLAKLLEPSVGEGEPVITAPTVTVGTPAYVAPEMATGTRRADPRSDLYALGIMTFEMLVGSRPYQAADPAGMLREHIATPIPSASIRRPQLPRAVDGFMQIALAKDPEQRFQGAEAFASALSAALGLWRTSE